MKSSSPHTYLPGLFVVTLMGAVGCIVGCQSPGASDSAAQKLARYGNTYTMIAPKDNLDPFADPQIDEAAQSAVRMELRSRGYSYTVTQPTNLQVLVAWQKSQETQPGSGAPLAPNNPGQNTISMVTLTVVVKDGAADKILWQSPPMMPVHFTAFSQANAEALVHKAMESFPTYSGTAR